MEQLSKQKRIKRTYLETLRYFAKQNKEIKPKPIAYKCLKCGRDKFQEKVAHKCNGYFRISKFKWEAIYEQNINSGGNLILNEPD